MTGTEKRTADVKNTEKIPVYIYIENGVTRCICHAGRRRCSGFDGGKKPCERDTVTRDKYREWLSTMRRDIYGK